MTTVGDAAQQNSPRRASRPTRRVLSLVALLAVIGIVLWAGLQAHPPEPPEDSLRIPWWVLAMAFAATEVWVFHIQVGRESKSISISEIPFMLAFFYSLPEDLLIARVVGPALVILLYRRQTLLKSGFNMALIFADTTVALLVFRVIGGGSTADGAREWTGAVLACVAAMAVDLIVLSIVIRWYDGKPPVSGVRSLASGLGLAAASALIGLVPLVTLRGGAEHAAVPLIASGVMLMFGYRAYASLSDRHSSLEQLFSFSRELSVAPETDDVLPSVLAQARELLRGERAEVLRFGDPAVTVWRFDGTQVSTLDADLANDCGEAARALLQETDAVLVRGDDSAGRHYLRLSGADEAVLAPLSYDGQTVGAIAVHDRLGEVRGFSASDVQLLQTIASHASVALHNEMLIGRLRHDALHDTLTGLPNRAQLTAKANLALADLRMGAGTMALMIMDLNGFKVVNDTLGHHVGDDLLRQVASRLTSAAPRGVTVARLGGDEFAVLMTAQATEKPEEIALGLLESLEETFVVEEERLHLSGAAGIALAPDHGRSVSDLLKRADIAMYAAKNGAEPCVVYRSDIDLNDASLLSLMGELREAISAGEVDIEVEPLIDLSRNRIVSTEALVRWHHPVRGTLRPSLFLPLAERNGLIVPLTTLVLDRAVAACASWREAGLDIGISVNLSARSLLDTMLPQTVADALDRWGLPSNRLTLEITETIVLSDADRALGLLADLRRLGVRLSLDDFGTGYSSLTHLSELPIQQLKIDRSFVSQVQDSPRDRAIVGAVADLARNLDLEVVAEGIEKASTAALLHDLGCQVGQGHFFAESMAPELLPLWVQTRDPGWTPSGPPRGHLLRVVR
ncbi:MAG TPA: EAL domain-containing protein [Actinomycetes bacterium]|nr:EAL domain-containing protein [Actinomycetes bacterium]